MKQYHECSRCGRRATSSLCYRCTRNEREAAVKAGYRNRTPRACGGGSFVDLNGVVIQAREHDPAAELAERTRRVLVYAAWKERHPGKELDCAAALAAADRAAAWTAAPLAGVA